MRKIIMLLLSGIFICANHKIVAQEIEAGIYSGINLSNPQGDINSGKWNSKNGPINSAYVNINLLTNNLLSYSRDGGSTWTSDTAGINPHNTLGTVYTTKAGPLFYGGSNFLYKSVDDGHTWKLLPTPLYAMRFYVTEDDKIIAFVENGENQIFTSVDYGTTFKDAYDYGSLLNTNTDFKLVNHYGSYYYICLTGTGIDRTKNFITFQHYWRNSNLGNLFIDHQGILIARDANYGSVYYMNDTLVSR